MIGGTAIARRYARAVFGLGEGDPARTSELLEEFDGLTDEVLSNDELRRCLLTPLFP